MNTSTPAQNRLLTDTKTFISSQPAPLSEHLLAMARLLKKGEPGDLLSAPLINHCIHCLRQEKFRRIREGQPPTAPEINELQSILNSWKSSRQHTAYSVDTEKAFPGKNTDIMMTLCLCISLFIPLLSCHSGINTWPYITALFFMIGVYLKTPVLCASTLTITILSFAYLVMRHISP